MKWIIKSMFALVILGIGLMNAAGQIDRVIVQLGEAEREFPAHANDLRSIKAGLEAGTINLPQLLSLQKRMLAAGDERLKNRVNQALNSINYATFWQELNQRRSVRARGTAGGNNRKPQHGQKKGTSKKAKPSKNHRSK